MNLKTSRTPYPVIPIFAALLALSLLGSCASSSAAAGAEEPETLTSGSPIAGPSLPLSGEIPPLPPGRKALVVYFSQGSAGSRVAEDLAALLGADRERVEEKRERRGFLGFMGGGMFATFRWPSRIEPTVKDPAGYDIVAVVTPVWSWSLSPPMRAWLRRNRGRLPEASLYLSVSGDTEPEKIVRMMEKESGRAPLAYVGFSERHFAPENRGEYVEKLRRVVDTLR